ncbi:MAG: restriction endonuclease [Nitrospirota bacterium]
MSLQIIKASGKSEEFDITKLVDSLVRSGASESIAQEIAEKVENQLSPASHTKHIFRLAKRLLKQYNRVSDMRYSIKKAIYALGPSGYQFEKYFGRILKEYGYSVEVNRILRGYCVSHEIDVLAVKENRGFVIECKYRSNGGVPTDVKIALYVNSRFNDIRKAYESSPEQRLIIKEGWLVTNTRCSSDAIKYAECVGLKIVSWKYPEKESLEKMIENRRLYPVTILSSIRKNSIETLFRNNIILAKDIADLDEKAFLGRSGIDAGTALNLKREADELCV